MADLIRKTQFEKICPFPVLNGIMTYLQTFESQHQDMSESELLEAIEKKIQSYESFTLRPVHHMLAIEIAAMAALLAKKTRDIKPDSQPKQP